MSNLCPFWVNRIPKLRIDSPSSLTLHDLLYCNPNDTDEVWTDVILASFVTDMDWVLGTAPSLFLLKGHLFVISGGKGASKELESSAYCKGMRKEKITVIEPPFPVPLGLQHSKLALCMNKKGIRVSVFTANLLPDDWNNKTQGIYVQDFPRVSDMSSDVVLFNDVELNKGNRFKHELRNFLSRCGLFTTSVLNKNFSDTFLDNFTFTDAAVELIASVPGYHKDLDANRFGLGGLGRCLQVTDMRPGLISRPSTLTWQFSSQGKLTDKFLSSLETAMLTEGISNKVKVESTKPTVQVVYPTEYEVQTSIEGWKGGLSLPVRLQCCDSYINRRLYRWGQQRYSFDQKHPFRENALPHLKTYLRLDDDRKRLKWFLLTSANLSRGAWGEWQKKGTQLMIRSYELGVLYSSDSVLRCENEGCFSVTPFKPIPKPSSIEGDGLIKVHIENLLGQDGPLLFLPYDPISPKPYLSTLQLQNCKESESLEELSKEDIPWIIDIPHSGNDSLGKCVHEAMVGVLNCNCRSLKSSPNLRKHQR